MSFFICIDVLTLTVVLFFYSKQTEIYSGSTMIIFGAAGGYFQCILLPTTTKEKFLSIGAVVYNAIPNPASERTLESTNELMGGLRSFPLH